MPAATFDHDLRLDTLCLRARAEFAEMPGMRLTLHQAARLWGVDLATAERLLAALLGTGFLRKRRDGYSRVAAT